MFTDYHAREERLFNKWAKRARELHENDEIAKDGLLYRGELWFDGYGQVHRPGDEEQRWAQATRRLLVITRELYDEDGWDLRGGSGRVPSPHLANNKTAYRFYPNIELWTYGLMNTPGGKTLPFSKVDNQPKLQAFYEEAPIARINCRKQADGTVLTKAAMQKYLENYAPLLSEQVKTYDADIVLCLGGQGVIIDFLARHVYPDLRQLNEHCWHSPSTQVLVIKHFHPCYNVYSRKDMYTTLMRDYQACLRAVPEVLNRRSAQ